MNETLSVYRKEIKYVIPLQRVPELKKCLESLLIRDSYCNEGAYSVRSLYFDSVYNIDFAQKLAGIESRKKVRIRIYNGSSSLCKVELKQKNNDRQNKQSLILSRDDTEALITGRYEVLIKYFNSNEAAVRIYDIMRLGCYRPVVMIEYDRLAYRYPLYDTRVTLDMNIRAQEADFDFFSSRIHYIPVMYDEAVLEIKYSGKCVGFVRDAFSQFGLTQSSYSKYSCGRRIYYDFNY